MTGTSPCFSLPSGTSTMSSPEASSIGAARSPTRMRGPWRSPRMATGRESDAAHFADHCDGRRVLLVRAVRKIDARDVEPRLHERANHAFGARRGAQRADDLRARYRRGQDQIRRRESRQRCARPMRAESIAALTARRRRRLIGRAREVIHKSSGGLRYAGPPSHHHPCNPHRDSGDSGHCGMQLGLHARSRKRGPDRGDRSDGGQPTRARASRAISDSSRRTRVSRRI